VEVEEEKRKKATIAIDIETKRRFISPLFSVVMLILSPRSFFGEGMLRCGWTAELRGGDREKKRWWRRRGWGRARESEMELDDRRRKSELLNKAT